MDEKKNTVPESWSSTAQEVHVWESQPGIDRLFEYPVIISYFLFCYSLFRFAIVYLLDP